MLWGQGESELTGTGHQEVQRADIRGGEGLAQERHISPYGTPGICPVSITIDPSESTVTMVLRRDSNYLASLWINEWLDGWMNIVRLTPRWMPEEGDPTGGHIREESELERDKKNDQIGFANLDQDFGSLIPGSLLPRNLNTE